MSIMRFAIERFSVTSSKPFEADACGLHICVVIARFSWFYCYSTPVVAALRAAVGRLDVVEFAKASKEARTFSELENLIHRHEGRTGLMLFMELDLGVILRKETGLHQPKIVRFLIGNPLIMKEMAKHVPDVGSYAPLTVLVDERPDGVHLSYDKMASFLAPYANASALAVARGLGFKNREPAERVCGLTSSLLPKGLQPGEKEKT